MACLDIDRSQGKAAAWAYLRSKDIRRAKRRQKALDFLTALAIAAFLAILVLQGFAYA